MRSRSTARHRWNPRSATTRTTTLASRTTSECGRPACPRPALPQCRFLTGRQSLPLNQCRFLTGRRSLASALRTFPAPVLISPRHGASSPNPSGTLYTIVEIFPTPPEAFNGRLASPGSCDGPRPLPSPVAPAPSKEGVYRHRRLMWEVELFNKVLSRPYFSPVCFQFRCQNDKPQQNGLGGMRAA